MVLNHLEFTGCGTDSPAFKKNIHQYEIHNDHFEEGLKKMIKCCKLSLSTMKDATRANVRLANALKDMHIQVLGADKTEEEISLENACSTFAGILDDVEASKEFIMINQLEGVLDNLNDFLVNVIQPVQKEKKDFAKVCETHYSLVDRHVVKKKNQEDAIIHKSKTSMQLRYLGYAHTLTNSTRKQLFEFVEQVLLYIKGMGTFYHQTHTMFTDLEEYLGDISNLLINEREAFQEEKERVDSLVLQHTESFESPPSEQKGEILEGHLFLGIKTQKGVNWNHCFVNYNLKDKQLSVEEVKSKTRLNVLANNLNFTNNRASRTAVHNLYDVTDAKLVDEEQSGRLNCFEVFTKQGTTVLLQAVTRRELDLWVKFMDVSAAFSMPKPTGDLKVQSAFGIAPLDKNQEFMDTFTDYINENCLEMPGIYRISGQKTEINAILRSYFDNKNDFDFSTFTKAAICGAFKQILRELPEPMIPFSYYNGFIQAANVPGTGNECQDLELKSEIDKLPAANHQALKKLVIHLNLVAEHEETNKMGAANLGVVFGPTFMRAQTETVQNIFNIKFQNMIIERLITDKEYFFYESKDEAVSSVESNEKPVIPPKPRSKRGKNQPNVGNVRSSLYVINGFSSPLLKGLDSAPSTTTSATSNTTTDTPPPKPKVRPIKVPTKPYNPLSKASAYNTPDDSSVGSVVRATFPLSSHSKHHQGSENETRSHGNDNVVGTNQITANQLAKPILLPKPDRTSTETSIRRRNSDRESITNADIDDKTASSKTNLRRSRSSGSTFASQLQASDHHSITKAFNHKMPSSVNALFNAPKSRKGQKPPPFISSPIPIPPSSTSTSNTNPTAPVSSSTTPPPMPSIPTPVIPSSALSSPPTSQLPTPPTMALPVPTRSPTTTTMTREEELEEERRDLKKTISFPTVTRRKIPNKARPDPIFDEPGELN